MPRVFDNIEQELLSALLDTLDVSYRADFCVGYFNLRGWKLLSKNIEEWSGNNECCRLLVGMQRLPHDELRETLSLSASPKGIDNQTALRLKKRLAEEFRQQLELGAPTNEDEIALRKLAAQIREGKVIVKLFLKHALHAKLYLLFRQDPVNPITAYLGSSNLTFSGLSGQGELNVDVLDHDACEKLAKWFEDRWNNRFCVDISNELVEIIDESWAREELISPYYIYVKIAYHLSQEARAGLSEFRIPREFGKKLFGYQEAAVKIAAHHLNKRGGVVIGDVVGLGKTLMATALLKIFEEVDGPALILCPKNLIPMWNDYRESYGLSAKVLSLSRVQQELPDLRRYRVVLIDESHNLRNRQGKRYRAIEEYIRANDSKCVLLSATPYNKTYLDLANQLRLFLVEDADLGIRPERLLRELGETEFVRRHQCPVRSLAAFEKSEYPDDWRDLMRLYLVRRTRSFIQDNYAETDLENGRRYLTYEDGTRSYFPTRIPKTVEFQVHDENGYDQYASLYDDDVVNTISSLNLPRYGLGNYEAPTPHEPPTPTEAHRLQDLSRAGKRLMGFCRTNLFKRLESSGSAFQQSVERHILRNYVFLHAIENGLDLPLGTQQSELLDSRINDEDVDGVNGGLLDDDDNGEGEAASGISLRTEAEFAARAARIYADYSGPFRGRFKWLRPTLFVKELASDLRDDALALIGILRECGEWDATCDAKLAALHNLVSIDHASEKVLIFTQFADTVRYIVQELDQRGVKGLAGATGQFSNPTELAWRFSPDSNNKRDRLQSGSELRILVATDVLSEGQNLQDAAVVVNFDLPWAIVKLIQRAGRVDRIGQKAENILCYSFLPADGVERIIRLRNRVRQRLNENAEVVGTDEAFFEDEDSERTVRDLYHEKAGILDGDDDTEVDLASTAYQIWKNAVDADPRLQKTIPDLPNVVYSSRSHAPTDSRPEGVLMYLRTAEGHDALAYVDKEGHSITESQFEILKAAECKRDTPPQPRNDSHHELVRQGAEYIAHEEKRVGGQLGRPSGARFRTYERLKAFEQEIEGTLFATTELRKTIDQIYNYPLRQTATDILNRQLKSGIDDLRLAELVIALWEEGRLCLVDDEAQSEEPQIICSLGLWKQKG